MKCNPKCEHLLRYAPRCFYCDKYEGGLKTIPSDSEPDRCPECEAVALRAELEREKAAVERLAKLAAKWLSCPEKYFTCVKLPDSCKAATGGFSCRVDRGEGSEVECWAAWARQQQEGG